MDNSITRSKLKKQFLAGEISSEEFHGQLELALRYRGYHTRPGEKPQWSGPFHLDKSDAEADNAYWFNHGYLIGVYTEQR